MSASSKIRKFRTVIGNFVLPKPPKAKKTVTSNCPDPVLKEIRAGLKTLSNKADSAAAISKNQSLDLILGSLLAIQVRKLGPIRRLREAEFKIFSQWGDDGIIQWLVHVLDFPNKVFVEFGVQDYSESNTRFLMMNNNWSGLVMDGSQSNVDTIVNSEYFWKYGLKAVSAFIDCENVNTLIESAGIPREIGIIHIDIDGNDYWVWEVLTVVNPIVVIMEYNSVFGASRPITVPYDPKFVRTEKHFSNLYFGASLSCLATLATRKGYTFIGSNSAGNNAYFVRNDCMILGLPSVTVEDEFVNSQFRESRNEKGQLTYIEGQDRYDAIKGLPVWNVESSIMEVL